MTQKDIERERDRILREAGFEDIEAVQGEAGIKSPSNPLAHVHRTEDLGEGGEAFRRHAAETEEYYRRASHFLWEHQWYSELERRCWELHCDGASYTRIVRTMKREGYAIYRKRVHNTVNRLREEMLEDEAEKKRGPGRPRDPQALRRADAGAVVVPHTKDSALALDHVMAAMGVSAR